jgi:hypothetical protein
MSDTFLYTSPLDPRAKPLIDELIHEYDSRYGNYFSDEGAAAELNRYPPEAFAPPVGNFVRRSAAALSNIMMSRPPSSNASGHALTYVGRALPARFSWNWKRRPPAKAIRGST